MAVSQFLFHLSSSRKRCALVSCIHFQQNMVVEEPASSLRQRKRRGGGRTRERKRETERVADTPNFLGRMKRGGEGDIPLLKLKFVTIWFR